MIDDTNKIKHELEKFDKKLADSVRPLIELEEEDIYHKVIDKFSQGQQKH